MSVCWLDCDVPALVRLARLTDLAARGEVMGQVLAELRQLEDRFGLSPLARRRLQWEVGQAGAPNIRVVEGAPTEDRWLRVATSD